MTKQREPNDYLTEQNRRFKNFCVVRGYDQEYALERLLCFWESHHQDCPFCSGQIREGKCIKCGRSDDFEYEEMVMSFQKRDFASLQSYGGSRFGKTWRRWK